MTVFRPAYAQISELKLTASDAAAGDNFGWGVSISGDYAVVGAVLDDDSGSSSGSAYVFKRTGTSWAQEAHLLASDGTAGDQFGLSVSISGDYAVVGARYDDDNGSQSGSAYVFKRTGTSWAQEAHLLASNGTTSDFFGSSVSISGDYVVVGAFQDGDNGIWSGSAYVFKRTDTSWAEEAKLLASDGAADDWFGSSVSISGDYAVVGAWGDDDNGSKSGSAYVFKRTGTSWAQEANLLASDGAIGYFFGFPVSISGSYAVVGASGDGSGSAYVFKRSGTSWAEEAKLLASDGAAGDWFGFSVSISGDYVAVGAFADDDNGTDAGSVYVYNGFTSLIGVKHEAVGLAAEFALSQNYPNPFNPETVIEYSIPFRSEVNLIIYNLRGEEVAHLIDERKPAGSYTVKWDASNMASGIYFYRLQAGDFVRTRKMLLLK
ncbi:MAG: T9SS type A sorting domain-containing protein [Candidatus Marinimicrobia bacterium]|nr:T9SS type A sorting domain-containing protein [Candidatus Neomarinimicrobiota bacterium]